MTRTHRIMAVSLAFAMLLSGFAVGRFTNTDTPGTAAEATKSALVQPATAPENQTEQAFYLKDFKTGYDDGYNSALTNQTNNIVNTDRQGYNEGFKQGYADAFQPAQAQATEQFASTAEATPVVYRRPQRASYRPAPARTQRRGNSKLKTALTIAAPAAIGAGVGALVGGKKGAGVGALLGGGGGAAYHLFKNRDRR
jgi:hypothetical protein